MKTHFARIHVLHEVGFVHAAKTVLDGLRIEMLVAEFAVLLPSDFIIVLVPVNRRVQLKVTGGFSWDQFGLS